MQKKFFLWAVMAALMTGFTACNNPAPSGSEEEEKTSVDDQLTPEQSKEKLMSIASSLVGKFNTEDQKAAIKLADGLYEKYQNYDFEVYEDYYEHRYDELFRLPRYAAEVLRGHERVANVNRAYTFSFEKESVIWEADDANHTWVNKGKAPDNSVILRAKDKNGTMCEAKFWGEGTTKTYEYTWEEFHWEYPRIYVRQSDIIGGYGWGMYDGEYRDFYYSSGYGWYYYDGYGNMVNVNVADIPHAEVYDSNYNYYEYDPETGSYYRNDWDNGTKVSDGMRTATGVLPAKLLFTFKQGDTELIRIELKQEMVKNDHATFNLEAKVVNLRWTTDLNINSTNGSVAFAFYYNSDALLSGLAHVPSYKLIEKADSQSYEDWIEEYGDRYEELIKKIGSADAVIDINGQAQGKVNISNVGYAYRDFMQLDEAGVRDNTQEGAKQYCDLINGNQTNGIYYNSDVKQAEFRMQVGSEERYRGYYDEYDNWREETYTAYFPEPVLYFPADKTTYALEPYFNCKPFTNLQYSVEDLVNAYIQLSKFLYEEVGTVEF